MMKLRPSLEVTPKLQRTGEPAVETEAARLGDTGVQFDGCQEKTTLSKEGEINQGDTGILKDTEGLAPDHCNKASTAIK